MNVYESTLKSVRMPPDKGKLLLLIGGGLLHKPPSQRVNKSHESERNCLILRSFRKRDRLIFKIRKVNTSSNVKIKQTQIIILYLRGKKLMTFSH